MRHVVLPILAEREAVSFCISFSATTKTKRPPQPPNNALGWPVFDREGKLMAVVVAVDHYLVGGEEEEEEADDDDEGRRDASSDRKGVVVGKGGRQYAAFGVEEERMMVNLCSQVRTVIVYGSVDDEGG